MDPIDYRHPDSTFTPCVNWHRRYLIGGFVIGLIHLAGSLLILVGIRNETLWATATLSWTEYPNYCLYTYVYEYPFGAALEHAQYAAGISMLLGDAVFWGLGLIGIWHAGSAVANARRKTFHKELPGRL